MQLADERLKPHLSELADMLRHELQSAGISLQLDLTDLRARVDILRVRQAVLALVNNARRHASPETIGIALFARDGKVVIRWMTMAPVSTAAICRGCPSRSCAGLHAARRTAREAGWVSPWFGRSPKRMAAISNTAPARAAGRRSS